MASTTWLEVSRGASTFWLEVVGTSSTWLGCISLSCTVCTRGVWRGRTSRMRGLLWRLGRLAVVWRLGRVERTVMLGTLVQLDTAGEDTRVSEVHMLESSGGGDGDTVEVDTTAGEGGEC